MDTDAASSSWRTVVIKKWIRGIEIPSKTLAALACILRFSPNRYHGGGSMYELYCHRPPGGEQYPLV